MRTILFAATMLVVTASAAHAETFSLSGTDQVTLKMTARDRSGRSVTTTMTTISQLLTSATGARTVTGRCTSRPASYRRNGLVSVGVCELGDGAGTFSVSFSCKTSIAQAGALDCAGETSGISGSYLAKTGKMSWRAAANADGSERTSTGSGEWN